MYKGLDQLRASSRGNT